ncbi:hypothetical protein LEP1GSC005_2534 [Leptospira santarosai str. ST188]|uniref:Uncharacterized protein n=1 Tax=Leptospira santarosai serovar Arenal str. MAVJ 401 TaxID=1049976 RepID=M6JH42_9LEPT|nr:hypothetical protein LEP1GSC005_2534 [Leptospira santarosai str. ST188]EMN21244.1 hypothetical protein LEP1GSC063_4385 [Leptospira santarosai serovar Arenal str. MAVJ 401]EMO70158.1 hypothetical protein LEP1GSC130_3170 [Leptospira santarosai str. 200403458]EMO97172.1 hypothetical protein LEP1GSC120_3933 [Leptospira santarosai str. 200702252]
MLRGIFIKSEDRGFKIKFPYEIAVLRPNQTMRNSFYRGSLTISNSIF